MARHPLICISLMFAREQAWQTLTRKSLVWPCDPLRKQPAAAITRQTYELSQAGLPSSQGDPHGRSQQDRDGVLCRHKCSRPPLPRPLICKQVEDELTGADQANSAAGNCSQQSQRPQAEHGIAEVLWHGNLNQHDVSQARRRERR